MNNFNRLNSNAKQAVLPMLIQDYLDICDPVLTFDRLMGGIDLEKYLKNIQKHYTGECFQRQRGLCYLSERGWQGDRSDRTEIERAYRYD